MSVGPGRGDRSARSDRSSGPITADQRLEDPLLGRKAHDDRRHPRPFAQEGVGVMRVGQVAPRIAAVPTVPSTKRWTTP